MNLLYQNPSIPTARQGNPPPSFWRRAKKTDGCPRFCDFSIDQLARFILGAVWRTRVASFFVPVGLILAISSSTKAAVITARTASLADVTVALNSAANGDTIQIPAGTTSWTQPLIVTKGVQIIAAGIDQTVITNQIVVNGVQRKDAALFKITTSASQPMFRLSGITINGIPTDPGQGGTATIQVGGDTPAFRVDHIRWNSLRQWSIHMTGTACGVIDHCKLENNCIYESMIMAHGSWGGKSRGDGSWADDAYWASGKAVYIEDCVLNAKPGTTWVVDALPPGGARYVIRHCTIIGDVSSHGTETSARSRSCRTMEVYNNRIIAPGTNQGSNGIIVRGGSATIFNNYLTSWAVPITTWIYGLDFRRGPWFGYNLGWGPADGANPWDLNDKAPYNGISPTPDSDPRLGSVYASGTYTGSNIVPGNGSGATVTLSGLPAPSADCWKGFTVRNITQLARHNAGTSKADWWGYITSNTQASGGKTIISCLGDSQNFIGVPFLAGDKWEMRKVDVVLDQSGRGKGDLLGGEDSLTANTVFSRSANPRQMAEGIYQWNNATKATSTSTTWSNVTGVSSRYTGQVKQNRDWFNGVRPTYPWNASTSNTPANRVGADNDSNAFYVQGSGGYTYPHPLITGGPTPAAPPKPPSNLQIVPGT